MKTRYRGLIVAGSLWFLMGCQSEEEQEVGREAEQEMEQEADTFIPFTDCVCEYDNGDFQIYTKNSSESGTVFYMQTENDDMQISAADEYGIDYENGAVFCVERDEYDYFISIDKYCAAPAGEPLKVSREEILSLSSVEKLLAEPYELTLSDTENSFSMKSVYVTALECERGSAVLKGEAYGRYNPTGECCHVDWEINTMTGEGKSTPHEKKIYDEENDKEIFEACDKAYREIDEGNWLELSDLKDWRESVDWESIQGYKEVSLWMRVDIDGDNLPELISVRGYEDNFILPINRIYSYIGAIMKPIEQVYWDPSDHSEFLYFGSTGNLIYENCDSGQLTNGRFAWYQFDEIWSWEPILELEFDYFYEDTDYSEEEREYFKEYYPDTYGNRGADCYYYKISPKSAEERKDRDETKPEREEISLKEFMSEYEQITGFDFFEVYPYYEYIRK